MPVHKKISTQNKTYCGITIEETGDEVYNVELTVYEDDVTCQACLDANPEPPSGGEAPNFNPE